MSHCWTRSAFVIGTVVVVAIIIRLNPIRSSASTNARNPAPIFASWASSQQDPTPIGTWSNWPEQPTHLDLRDVYFYAAHEGWAVGGQDEQGTARDTAVILHFLDGHWSIMDDLPPELRTNVSLRAVDGTGPSNIWVAGKGYRHSISDQSIGVLFHFDGETWQEVPLPDTPLVAPLTDIDVVSTEAGYELWAISEANHRNTSYILHFNGTMTVQDTIQNRSLLGIHMLSPTEGQIVTRGAGGAPDGHHYWYHDGFWQGTSVWTPQPLNAVSMAEPTYGWAVGNRGATDEYVGQCHTPATECSWYARQALRSADGAAINPNLWDVQIVSQHEGWVVGEPWNGQSTIAYLTQDPNPRWRVVSVEQDPVKALYGLEMITGPDERAIEGWAVGAAGTILHYSAPQPESTPLPGATASPTASPTLSSHLTGTPEATPSPTAQPYPTRTATATATVMLSPPAADLATPSPAMTPRATPTVSSKPSPTASPALWRIHLPLISRLSRSDLGGPKAPMTSALVNRQMLADRPDFPMHQTNHGS